MDIAGGGITLSQEEYLFAMLVYCHVNHHDGMPVLLTIAGWIDKHIAWLHIGKPTCLHLTTQRERTRHTIEITQIALKRFARCSPTIAERFPIHILETDATILACIEEILRTQSHTNISTLLGI